jgi:hypothetical protein
VPGGTQRWVQRFGGAHLSATATSVAASPDKAVVYVTGITTKTVIGLRNEVTVTYVITEGQIDDFLKALPGVLFEQLSSKVNDDVATVYARVAPRPTAAHQRLPDAGLRRCYWRCAGRSHRWAMARRRSTRRSRSARMPRRCT